MTKLQILLLSETKVTDAGLDHLHGLNQLRRLALGNTKITNLGLAKLNALSELYNLDLEGTQVTNAGLVHLKGLTQLQKLALTKTKITDSGLTCLEGLTKLEWLGLRGTTTTNAGLEHLKGLTRLRWLYLGGTQVTDSGVKKLQQSLPNCKIDRSVPRIQRASASTIPGQGMLESASTAPKPASPKANDQPHEKPAEALTYTGQVTDKLTGKPIAGATVTVLRRASSRTMAFEKWPKLGETKHQADAKGRYTFTVPPDQAANERLYIEITAQHPNYARFYGGYSFAMIRKNDKLGERPFFENIALEPSEKIFGTIVNPEGKPAAGVMVRAFSLPGKDDFESSSWTDVTTNEKGYFQFNVSKQGQAVFWILPTDFAPSTHVANTKRGDFGRFVLEKGLILQGRVVDSDGKPLSNVWVNADICGGPAKKSIGMPVFDHLARSALSNQKGEFVMSPLPAGEYDVIVADQPRGGLKNSSVHPVPAVFLNRKITLDPDEPTTSIEVRAVPHVIVVGHFVDGSGKPTSGFEPHIWGTRDDASGMFWAGKTQMDEHGRFVAMVPKGLRIRLSLIDNEHHALRTRVSKDAPLSIGREADLGILDRDMTDVTVIRYVAPVLLVKAVTEEGATIKAFQAKIKYLSGRWLEGEYLREGKPAGDIAFKRQDDGRWRTSQLLPDGILPSPLRLTGMSRSRRSSICPKGRSKNWRSGSNRQPPSRTINRARPPPPGPLMPCRLCRGPQRGRNWPQVKSRQVLGRKKPMRRARLALKKRTGTQRLPRLQRPSGWTRSLARRIVAEAEPSATRAITIRRSGILSRPSALTPNPPALTTL